MLEKKTQNLNEEKENQSVYFMGTIKGLKEPLNQLLGCLEVVCSQAKAVPDEQL